jgi:hypothetical protein
MLIAILFTLHMQQPATKQCAVRWYGNGKINTSGAMACSLARRECERLRDLNYLCIVREV